MELQQTLTMLNSHLLIPKLLENIKKLDPKNYDKYSISEKLSKLPTPPESELNYLFYSPYFSYVISNFLVKNYEVMSGELPPKWGLGKWMLEEMSGNIMLYYVLDSHKKDSDFLKNLYKDSNSFFLLGFLVKKSIYFDISCLNFLAEKKDAELQKIAAASCNLETVKLLTKSPYDKVRLAAYQRLGPMEYLDEMLIDKSRHVRSLAAGWMPMGYRVPQKTLSERAFWSFSKLIEKVSLDQIPMLLANKNLKKNKHLTEILQKRLDSKF